MQTFIADEVRNHDFGKLELLRHIKGPKGKQGTFLFRCLCGQEIQRVARNLMENGSVGCPECRRKAVAARKAEEIAQALISDSKAKFGKLTAIRPITVGTKPRWEFKCDCGRLATYRMQDVKRGAHDRGCPICKGRQRRQEWDRDTSDPLRVALSNSQLLETFDLCLSLLRMNLCQDTLSLASTVAAVAIMEQAQVKAWLSVWSTTDAATEAEMIEMVINDRRSETNHMYCHGGDYVW